MFRLIEEYRIPLDDMNVPRLARLLAYWTEKCDGDALPRRVDIDPTDLREHLGLVHLVDVVAPGTFRFRLYGSEWASPYGRDMTGRTTADYEDREFGALVTRHYQECVDGGAPVCHYVCGELERRLYAFLRLVLPMTQNGQGVDMLLVSPHRCQEGAHPYASRR